MKLERCPKCRVFPFRRFMRWQVARFDWFGLRKRIYCVICGDCKEIVDYEEKPADLRRKP